MGASLPESGGAQVYGPRGEHNHCKCKDLCAPQRHSRMDFSARPVGTRDRWCLLCVGLQAAARSSAEFKHQPDGSVVIGYPKPGYNNHFWVIDRGTYPAGSVDGVYVQMDMRVSDPNMKFVANVGADWWRDASAVFLRSFVNNPGAGMSNWIELSTDWTTLYFYSWSTDRLLTDPPPPLNETKSSPTVVRRRASNSPTYLPDRRGDSPIIVPSPTSHVTSHPR